MSEEHPLSRELIETFVKFNRAEWQQRMLAGQKRSEMMVLFAIQEQANEEEPAMRVSDISSLLRVTSPTVSQLINALEAKGLVERISDSHDRRAVRVGLTDAGKQLTAVSKQRAREHTQGLIDYLGEEDAQKLAELLNKLFDYHSSMREQFQGEEDVKECGKA
ncbi:MarR family winged helix-turn-helix transcriptional regulator [Paenibacillus marinisediminis]